MADVTKERILAAAEALFAEKGYDAVTIREITAKARCNLSLVYYYFGGKKKLYIEMFRQRWITRAHAMQRTFFEAVEKRAPQSLEEIIELIITVFL